MTSWSNNNVFAQLVVIYGTGTLGLFIYDGQPANGNPPVAWAVPPGVTTDPYSNTLIQAAGEGGWVTQDPATGAGAELAGGVLYLWGEDAANIISAATVQVGTGLQAGELQIVAPVLAAGFPAPARIIMVADASFGNGQLLGDQWVVAPAATQVTPITTELLEVQGFAAAKGLVSLFGSAKAPWNTVTPNTGFTAGGTTPRYQYEGINGGRVRLAGSINLTANQASGATMFTVGAGYVPVVDQFYSTGNNLSGFTAGADTVEVDTSGNVHLAVSGTSGNFVILDNIVFTLD